LGGGKNGRKAGKGEKNPEGGAFLGTQGHKKKNEGVVKKKKKKKSRRRVQAAQPI